MEEQFPSTTPAGARHAGILPSFAIKRVPRALKCTSGLVQPGELLNWERPELLASADAEAVRNDFVARRRLNFEELWICSINVSLPADWDCAVTPDEAVRVSWVLSNGISPDQFPRLTLKEFKEIVRLPVAKTLGLLAKIEAYSWEFQPGAEGIGGGAIVEVTDEYLNEVRSCLAAPWIGDIAVNDIRFPQRGPQKFTTWLGEQLGSNRLPESVHRRCQRLLKAHKATWAEELEDLISTAIAFSEKRPASAEARERWLKIILMRHGGKRGLELQGVGDAFGLTRERVRQICEPVEAVLRERPTAAPALDRLLSQAALIMPLSTEQADEQLASLLGVGGGVHAAIEFADLIEHPNPIRRTSVRSRTLEGYRQVPIVESTAAPATWAKAALAHARSEVTFVGATNYRRVAGYLALELGVAQNLDSLTALFSKAPGYRLLDDRSGWFTLADSDQSSLASRVRKLASIAPTGVDIDTIATALMTDDRWLARPQDKSMTIPPLHVLAALIAGWPWLSANGHNVYAYTGAVTDTTTVLSDSEQAALQAIEAHGGAATRAEIVKRVIGETGISDIAVSLMLSTSPVIWKLELSLYAVRGRPIPAEALTAARERRAVELGRTLPSGAINLAEPVRVTVTQSGSDEPPYKRVVYLPTYLSGLLVGEYVDASGQHPSIGVRPGNQVRALSGIAETVGIGKGERFDIVFDVLAGTYTIIPPSAA